MADFKKVQKVKVLDDLMSNNVEECNDFLNEIGTRCISCVSHYNTTFGVVVFVINYHDVESI